MKTLSDQEAINVLNTWIAFEVLSPCTFKPPKPSKDYVPKTININEIKFLPWENGGEKTKKDERIHYHLILGTINLERATAKLVEKFDHSVFESPKVNGEAIMSVITLNQQGQPVAINFSSYAWGINQALNGDLSKLADWMKLERRFTDMFVKDIYQYDEDRRLLPFDRSDIENAYLYVNEILEIPESLASRNQYVTPEKDTLKITQPPPSPHLLNSFYLEDLNHAKNLIIKKIAPDSLKRYLGMKMPKKRCNILEDNEALANIIAPKNIPFSKWPGKGRHSLVLLQQAAVNAAKTELKDEGILAVNGPPGTGKTTLLRDIVASILTDRAIALSKFDDPLSAFSLTDYEIFSGKSKIALYKIDESLRGFEILIASTNNKAVENISKELPALSAIDKDAGDLRFFSDLANNLYNGENWGVIAAVLGRSANRKRFDNLFWSNTDDDSSTFLNYLLHIVGYRQEKDIWDEKSKKNITKVPDIIINNDPPSNRIEALKRWKAARINFKNALDKCKSKLYELENLRQSVLMLESLAAELGLDKQALIDLILEHQKNKPNIFLRIFRHHKAIAWKNKQEKIIAYNKLNKILEYLIEKYKNHIIDKDFFEKDHADKNQFIPWCDAQMQSLRDDLFIQTMKLNKAFIDAAAKALRHNIGIFMNILSKQTIHFDKPEIGQTKESIMEVLPHAWSSFFLVVSTISTTFASAGKMLDHIPPSAFGWLIIDEAGQAIPQAAVGAIIRVKRVVVTGDPLQIEPIVTLPTILTENICSEFNVESNRFNAPKASVQTLADSASSYYAEFQTFEGSRSVGFPLLVHRRCGDPMFTISNVIAYESMMVQFKNRKKSKIRECLGESQWFDIIGHQAEEQWCPEEGIKVIQILNKIKQYNIYPDLYIITPFKIIAENLRKLITKSEVMNNWHEINPKDWIDEHIGTIHTVQGREADTVILVLGATSLEQYGTRMWAGKEPNILNVAVTRAKENLYVVGNRELWKKSGVFSELYNRIRS